MVSIISRVIYEKICALETSAKAFLVSGFDVQLRHIYKLKL
jgi:hypothetical protein